MRALEGDSDLGSSPLDFNYQEVAASQPSHICQYRRCPLNSDFMNKTVSMRE